MEGPILMEGPTSWMEGPTFRSALSFYGWLVPRPGFDDRPGRDGCDDSPGAGTATGGPAGALPRPPPAEGGGPPRRPAPASAARFANTSGPRFSASRTRSNAAAG